MAEKNKESNKNSSKEKSQVHGQAQAEPSNEPETGSTSAETPRKPRVQKPGTKRISGFDIDEKIYKEICEIAAREDRSPGMQVLRLIREGLEFEKQKFISGYCPET